MRVASRQSDGVQYEGGGRTASIYDTILGTYEKGGGLKGSKDRYPKGKGKSKAYPMVSKGNFAGGSRSYPIPTQADAVDALRLAGLHGRSDVRAKVYAKYPGLKKEDGGKIQRPKVYTRNLNGPGGFTPPTSDYANPSEGGGTEAANNMASRRTGGRNMKLQTSKKCRGGLLYKCRGGRLKR
jgi:hypothetical protein